MSKQDEWDPAHYLQAARSIEVNVTVNSVTTVNVVVAGRPDGIIKRLSDWFKKK